MRKILLALFFACGCAGEAVLPVNGDGGSGDQDASAFEAAGAAGMSPGAEDAGGAWGIEDSGKTSQPYVMNLDAGYDSGANFDVSDSGQFDAGPDGSAVDAGVASDAMASAEDAGVDAGSPEDAGTDSGAPDAGRDAGLDAGTDAGVDAGTDAGTDGGDVADSGMDAAMDAGDPDAGQDAGTDAGVDSGPPPDPCEGIFCFDGNTCTNDACVNGVCVYTPLNAGQFCSVQNPTRFGTCHEGSCCLGCWNGFSCLDGSNASACGSAGQACTSCSDGNSCTLDVCSGGACSNPDRVDYTDCGGANQCIDGSCESVGGLGEPCRTGSFCDDPGTACDTYGNCVVCGGLNQVCCDGDSCDAGMACSANKCRSCGGRNQPCCPGSTCGDNLTCNGSTCSCGGLGEPCCRSSTCGNYLCGTCDGGMACRSSSLCS